MGLSGLLGGVGGCGHEGSALRDILGLRLTSVHIAGRCIFVLVLLIFSLFLKLDLLPQKKGSKRLQDVKCDCWIGDLKPCKKFSIFGLVLLDEQLVLQIGVDILILLAEDMLDQFLHLPIVVSDPLALLLLQPLRLLLLGLEVVVVGYLGPSLRVLEVLLSALREDIVFLGCVDRQHLS